MRCESPMSKVEGLKGEGREPESRRSKVTAHSVPTQWEEERGKGLKKMSEVVGKIFAR